MSPITAAEKNTNRPGKTKPETPPSNIGEYLDRMIADAEEIRKKLQGAPVHLTGIKEQNLWNTILETKKKLLEAKAAWVK